MFVMKGFTGTRGSGRLSTHLTLMSNGDTHLESLEETDVGVSWQYHPVTTGHTLERTQQASTRWR